MKLRNFTLIITVALGVGSVFAEESKSPWHSFVSLEGGLYNSDEAYLGLVEGGIGYQVEALTHYVFVGAGQVSRDGERITSGSWDILENTQPDLQEFEFGYRAAYRLNEKTCAFAELGAESLRGDTDGTDALGNSITLSFDSDHYFVGAGFQRDIWNGINLNFSCRYLPSIDDAAFSRAGMDALGNVRQFANDTPNFLVKLGVSYSY
jgi:hypothetical protein